jgi:hypothetical protein
MGLLAWTPTQKVYSSAGYTLGDPTMVILERIGKRFSEGVKDRRPEGERFREGLTKLGLGMGYTFRRCPRGPVE